MPSPPAQPSRTSSQPQSQAADCRSVLLVRDIDKTASIESVMSIFDSENCPTKPVHCENALETHWYVTFKNAEDASLALYFIRKGKPTWKGKPIMAGYKTKPASTTSSANPSQTHQNSSNTPQLVNMSQVALSDSDNRNVMANRGSSAFAPNAASNQLVSANDNIAATSSAANLTTPSSTIVDSTPDPSMRRVLQPATASLVPTVSSASINVPQDVNGNNMMAYQQSAHQHPMMQTPLGHPMMTAQYGCSTVSYYTPSMPGIMTSPWNYHGEAQPYELTDLILLNNLTPYSGQPIKGNPNGGATNPKMINNPLGSNVGGGITNVSLIGAPPAHAGVLASVPYHHHQYHHPHPHHHPHSNNNSQSSNSSHGKFGSSGNNVRRRAGKTERAGEHNVQPH